MEGNPNSSELVPTQISSTAELKTRVQTVLNAVQEAKKRLGLAKEKLAVVEKTCDNDLQKALEGTKEQNAEI